MPIPANFTVKSMSYYGRSGVVMIHNTTGSSLRACDINYRFRIIRTLTGKSKLWTVVPALSIIPSDVILEAFYE